MVHEGVELAEELSTAQRRVTCGSTRLRGNAGLDSVHTK